MNIFNIINNIANRCTEQDEEGDETQQKIETYRRSESEAVVIVKTGSRFPNDFQESVLLNCVEKFLFQVVQSALRKNFPCRAPLSGLRYNGIT